MNMSGMQTVKVRRLKSSWLRIPVEVPFHSYRQKPIRTTMPMTSVERTRALVHAQGLPPSCRPANSNVSPVAS